MVRVRWLYSRAPLALMLRASGSGLPCFALKADERTVEFGSVKNRTC